MGALSDAVFSPLELGVMHSVLDISCRHLMVGDLNLSASSCVPISSKGVIRSSWVPPQCPQVARGWCRALWVISSLLVLVAALLWGIGVALFLGKGTPFRRSPLGGMVPARWESGSDTLATLLHLSAVSISLCCWLCSSPLDLSLKPRHFNLPVASKEFPKARGDSGAEADSTVQAAATVQSITMCQEENACSDL